MIPLLTIVLAIVTVVAAREGVERFSLPPVAAGAAVVVAGLVANYVIGRWRLRVAAASPPSTGPGGALVLRQPFSWRLGWIVCASALVTLVALIAWGIARSAFSGGETVGAAVFVLLSVIGLVASAREVFQRVASGATGLERDVPLARPRSIAWSDVASIGYEASDKALVVTAGDGSVIETSLHLCGIRQLYQELHRRVPAEKWTSVYAPFEQARSAVAVAH
jgi:hypothetical protein